MAADDFDVVEYKVLAFLYQSIKDGVRPTYEKAAEVAKVNPVYWDAVIGDLVDLGYVRANVIRMADSTRCGDIRITSAGVDFLETSPRMRRVGDLLGAAFEVALKVAIESLKSI